MPEQDICVRSKRHEVSTEELAQDTGILRRLDKQMIAKITRIDNKGETTIAEEHVESFREAFAMFMDDVLDRKKDDFYVWEDYDRMTRGRNNL